MFVLWTFFNYVKIFFLIRRKNSNNSFGNSGPFRMFEIMMPRTMTGFNYSQNRRNGHSRSAATPPRVFLNMWPARRVITLHSAAILSITGKQLCHVTFHRVSWLHIQIILTVMKRRIRVYNQVTVVYLLCVWNRYVELCTFFEIYSWCIMAFSSHKVQYILSCNLI